MTTEEAFESTRAALEQAADKPLSDGGARWLSSWIKDGVTWKGERRADLFGRAGAGLVLAAQLAAKIGYKSARIKLLVGDAEEVTADHLAAFSAELSADKTRLCEGEAG